MDAISEEEEKAEVAASRPLLHHVTITGRTIALVVFFWSNGTTKPSALCLSRGIMYCI